MSIHDGVDRNILGRARTDALDRLIEADEPLAGLHIRCGGVAGGTVAIPQLLEVVRKARTMGLRLARTIEASDGDDAIRAWVEVAPSRDDAGCAITVGAWNVSPRPPMSDEANALRRSEIDRELAEFVARLAPDHSVLAFEHHATDLVDLAHAIGSAPGRPWTDHVELPDLPHQQPVHWRLLDGARVAIPGSQRRWTATLLPLGQPDPGSAGFELLLIADSPLPKVVEAPVAPHAGPGMFGRELTPVLRQPIARIIANAETIRSRLAGPLADEYSEYAADIAAAGQHLLSLVDDLSDLEVVEAHDFATAPDRIDLGDVARRAIGILAVRARAKAITLTAPDEQAEVRAIGEFRRVLQVLLNLVGNAINYSPEGSTVSVTASRSGDRALVTVADQGPGLSPEQQARVFDKFERLGRGGDGGSGLGLYISRTLARAMGGELTVESALGEGARFSLSVPAAD